MKIPRSDSNRSPKLPPASPAGSSGGGPVPEKRTVAGVPSDHVQLSTLSSYLAAALSGSPAHVAKLAGLTTAVSTGRYGVDADTVSGSIIQHSIEFGGGGYRGLSI